MDIEAIRLSFKPAVVRILFVGESAPKSGKFFYIESRMTGYTQQAFEMALGKSFGSQSDFLRFFMARGCYLADWRQVPVDKDDPRTRMRILRESMPAFAERIRALDPQVVVIALKRIDLHVRTAVNRAELHVPIYTLPLAGNGTQTEYMNGLAEIVAKHL